MTTEHRIVELSGELYRIGKLSVRTQFHISRKLAPLLAQLIAVPSSKEEFLEVLAGPLAGALSDMKTEDADFVTNSCLEVVRRRQMVGQHETWPRVVVGGAIMFELDLKTFMGIVINTITDNLGSFFPTAPPESPSVVEKTILTQ